MSDCCLTPIQLFLYARLETGRIMWLGMAGVHTGFRTITLVLYIRSLPNLATWFPCGRGRTLFILGSLGQRSPLLQIEFLTTGSFLHDNFSSVFWIFTKLGHMIPLWKGENPIYIDGRILWCTHFLFSYIMARTS